MASLKTENVKTFDQAGVLPFRRKRGGVEFCLITSSRGRWIFPKGTIAPNESYKETATKEALEEAGVRGRLVGAPLGCWEMLKYDEPYTLVLLLMEVKDCADEWDEAHLRERRWVGVNQARKLLCQPPLRKALDTAIARLRGNKKTASQKRNLKDDRLILQQAKKRTKTRRAAKRA